MHHLPPEPLDRRSYLAWVAHFRSLERGRAAVDEPVSRRSEAFAEDLEGLTPVRLPAAAHSHRLAPVACGAG